MKLDTVMKVENGRNSNAKKRWKIAIYLSRVQRLKELWTMKSQKWSRGLGTVLTRTRSSGILGKEGASEPTTAKESSCNAFWNPVQTFENNFRRKMQTKPRPSSRRTSFLNAKRLKKCQTIEHSAYSLCGIVSKDQRCMAGILSGAAWRAVGPC